MEIENDELLFRWNEDDISDYIEADILMNHDQEHFRMIGSLYLKEQGIYVTGYTYTHNLMYNKPELNNSQLKAYELALKRINTFMKGRKDVKLSENTFDFITVEKEFLFKRAFRKAMASRNALEYKIRPMLLQWLKKIINHTCHDDVLLIEKSEIQF